MLCTGIYFSDSQVCAVSSDSHATEGHWFQALWMLPFWSDGPEDSLHRGWEHNSVSCLGADLPDLDPQMSSFVSPIVQFYYTQARN